MNLRNSFVAVAGLALGLAVGCGTQKQIENTEQNTAEINAKMSQMNELMAKMRASLEQTSHQLGKTHSQMQTLDELQKVLSQMNSLLSTMSDEMAVMSGHTAEMVRIMGILVGGTSSMSDEMKLQTETLLLQLIGKTQNPKLHAQFVELYRQLREK